MSQSNPEVGERFYKASDPLLTVAVIEVREATADARSQVRVQTISTRVGKRPGYRRWIDRLRFTTSYVRVAS